ncbi:MAG TPA: S53 family peptidase, partial [Candidatus Tumulicola sp.]|nr:S53 family peptidase [Candidatus Tumulicola sp.]
MNALSVRALAVTGIALLAACSGGSTNPSLPAAAPGAAPAHAAMTLMAAGPGATRQACPDIPAPGFARCLAVIRTDVAVRSGLQPQVFGYGPSDLQSAYNLPSSTAGKGQTIGIVDAFDDPNAESDLAVYRKNFGLTECSTKNKCFLKVGQSGSPTKLPKPNAGWAGEISLDLDMASAICPNCKILLVEASTNRLVSLGKAVDRAVQMGANVVSNSYGGGGGGGANQNYNHPGSIITASSGDGGYGLSSPCDYQTVVCIGGTSLNKGGGTRGWSETAWSGAGSACSHLVAKPSWQTDKGCTQRSEADVSAVADPSTGVAFYDTYPSGGWGVVGGTSVASPVIAGVFALAANESSLNYAAGIWQAGGTSALNDVTQGSNGSCGKKIHYICNAGPGYDGPTGWGTPNGVGAF